MTQDDSVNKSISDHKKFTLERLELHVVTLPQRRKHTWANLKSSIGTYLLVQLTDSDGFVGWGEATVLGSWAGDHGRYYGETVSTACHVIGDLIGPNILGVPGRTRHDILQRLEESIAGHNYAKTAVEEALLELWARRHKVGVPELLGGRKRDRIPLTHSIGLMPIDEVLVEARNVVDEGVRTLKIKVGVEPDRDVSLVSRLHRELGKDAELVLDANQGWRTAANAWRVLRQLSEFPIRYVEQPVEGLEQMIQLAPRSPFPLMADESMWTQYDMADLARTGLVPYASIYTSKAGGLHNAMVADAVASAFGIGTNLNGSAETGVGNLANLQLASSMVSLTEGSSMPVSAPQGTSPIVYAGRNYTDDLIAAPMELVDGHLLVPDGVGWGIDIDLERVATYREHYKEIRGLES